MLDPVLLRSFLTVVQAGSFTQAAQRLGLQQSTVSQHVKKLEIEAKRRLFIRDTHSVTLTADGDAMVGFARSILEANERAERYFAGSQMRGRLRFGTSEDFVLSGLPDILGAFVRSHPLVDLELTVGLSGHLYEKLDAGELDLVFGKRRRGEAHGRLVWRDRLVWIGSEAIRLDPAAPLPLLLFPSPSVTRERALERLEQEKRAWRIICTSGSLSGVRAAALAGLGVAAHARRLIPPGLHEIPAAPHLPDLGEIDFVVLGAERAVRGPAAELASVIVANSNRLRSVSG
jgi:DNA-binding transcriptional LysR family regulator